MAMQLLVGVPLEMVHGALRIGLVYMCGVLAGGCVVTNTHVYTHSVSVSSICLLYISHTFSFISVFSHHVGEHWSGRHFEYVCVSVGGAGGRVAFVFLNQTSLDVESSQMETPQRNTHINKEIQRGSVWSRF